MPWKQNIYVSEQGIHLCLSSSSSYGGNSSILFSPAGGVRVRVREVLMMLILISLASMCLQSLHNGPYTMHFITTLHFNWTRRTNKLVSAREANVIIIWDCEDLILFWHIYIFLSPNLIYACPRYFSLWYIIGHVCMKERYIHFSYTYIYILLYLHIYSPTATKSGHVDGQWRTWVELHNKVLRGLLKIGQLG